MYPVFSYTIISILVILIVLSLVGAFTVKNDKEDMFLALYIFVLLCFILALYIMYLEMQKIVNDVQKERKLRKKFDIVSIVTGILFLPILILILIFQNMSVFEILLVALLFNHK